MKRIFLIILTLICFSFQIWSQEWKASNVLKGSNIEPKYSSIDLENNLIILGIFQDTIYKSNLISFGAADLFILKVDSQNNIVWDQQIGSTGNETAGGICTDNSNNIYVVSNYSALCKFNESVSLQNYGIFDIFLAKYNSSGSLQWARTIAKGTTAQVSTNIKFDGDDNLVITGFFKDSLIIGSGTSNYDTLIGNSNFSHFIATFNTDGERIWAKRYLGNDDLTRFSRIGIGQNGYYFCGSFKKSVYFDIDTITSLTPAYYDAFLFKTDFDGNSQWIRKLSGISTENLRSLTSDEYDNLYLLGNYNSPSIFVDSTETVTKTFTGNTGGYDTYIGKYNRSGILQWFIRKGSTAKDIYNDFVVRNNVIYATGYFANQIIFNEDTLRTSGALNEDPFLAAFNQIGDPIAGVSIEGTGDYNDAGTIVNMDVNTRAYVSGYYKSQEIKIGDSTYTSNTVGKSDLFFAIYQHPFTAVITDEDMVSCYGLSDGMLQATPYFGRPPYTYSWSHDPNLHDSRAVNLPAGEYTVTITDANDSVARKTKTVIQPQPLAVSSMITPVSCFNTGDGAIDITVTGGTPDYTYFWSTLDGSGVQPLNQDQTGLTEGAYSVLVRDDNQCDTSAIMVITEPAPIRFTGSVVTDLTFPPGNNGAVDLHVSGGNEPYNFTWTGPNSYSASSEDISSLTAGGLYNLALTDNKNCPADTAFAVNDGITLIAQVTAKTDALCFGDDNGSAAVTVYNGVEPYTFNWSDGLVTPVSTRTGMSPGTYFVVVTDAATPTPNSSSPAEVVINEPASALNLILDGKDLRCYNDYSGVVNLDVDGGTLPYSFDWNNGYYTGEDLVNVAAGQYSVTVTDGHNCIAHGDTTLGQPEIFNGDIEITRELLCHGERIGELSANATGGLGSYTYLWDDPGAQITQTAVQLEAGEYTVIVTDQNECSISLTHDLTEPDTLTIQSTINDPACAGDENGSIVPVVSGGTPPFDYVWSNNVFTRINSDLPAGPYNLTVTDHNNCIFVQDYALTDPDPVVINSVDSTRATCFGLADGSVTINASGGTGVFQYSADDGQSFFTTPTVGSLAAGAYLAVVKDSNDCISENYPVSIGQPLEILVDTVTTTDATCFGYSDGSVSIVVTGGTGTYQYSADDGENYVASPDIGSLSAGNYLIRAVDEANCESASFPVAVGQADPYEVDTLEVVEIDASHPAGAITLTSAGGTSPVTYVIVPDSSTSTTGEFNDLQPDEYRLFAYDASLCRSSNDIVVVIEEPATDLVIYDAFSPNEDGKNDVWHIRNIEYYPDCSVKIFNTWGTTVFTSKGYGIPWDGKHNGNGLPSGTYYYIIDPGDGSGTLTGPVSLVK